MQGCTAQYTFSPAADCGLQAQMIMVEFETSMHTQARPGTPMAIFKKKRSQHVDSLDTPQLRSRSQGKPASTMFD